MHIIPLNIGDFSQATERFKPVHLGIYLRLLMEYYKSEKALPDEAAEIEWIAGVESKSEREALALVLRRCFVHDPARRVWIQRRCERELEGYRQQGMQKRYAILCRFWDSVNSGVKRPTLEEFTENVSMYYDESTRRIRQLSRKHTLVLQPYSDSDTDLPLPNYDTVTRNQEPVTSNQNTPVVPKGTNTPERLKPEVLAEAIYALYPRKVARTPALAAIRKALKRSGLTELELQARVREFAAATRERLQSDPKFSLEFVPHPATWFNQDRFNDDPATWAGCSSNLLPAKPDFGLENKEGGAAVAEPEWDWRALHVEVYGAPATGRWGELAKSVRFELRQAWEQKNGRGGAEDV